MQVQQDNIKKGQEKNNPFLVVSTEEIRNIAENLTQPIHPNEDGFIESLNQTIQNQQNELQTLKQQNTKLKSTNKQLVKQLQTFSKKLDQQIKRRAQSNQRRPKITLKPEEKQSIEIQNLYKKIEIYKRQVALLKSKIYDQTEGSNRINEYENKLKMFMKENEDLRDEIKSLKKIIKLQEKGLSDIGAQGFLKMTAENQKQKEELRRLRLQMDQVQRKYRIPHAQVPKIRYKTPQNIHNDSSEPYFSRSTFKNDFTSHKQIILNRKKNYSDYRTRTQPQITTHKEHNNHDSESQLNTTKNNLQKIQKLESKIRSMNNEKVRQREIIENLKIQILQKDKEVNYLRQKAENLHKINRSRRVRGTLESKENLAEGGNSFLEAIEQTPDRSHPHQQTTPMEDNINMPAKSGSHHESQGKFKQRYPRLQQFGFKKDSSYKWNHHQFSSKIKEVQVYLNQSGAVSYIHARYEKGEPTKPAELGSRKCSALVCEANSEYVIQIKGGFRQGRLQYLVVKTNQKRVVEFGNLEMDNECENFKFAISQSEFPCALLGEHDNEGVLRLGCFVESLPN